MNNGKLKLSDWKIAKDSFSNIEQTLRERYNPKKEEIVSVNEFYDYLENELFNRGLKDFVKFIASEKEKVKARLTEHFGNSLVSYLCGIDFKIYSLILEKLVSADKPICDVPFIGNLFSKHLRISDKIKERYFSLVQQPTRKEDVPEYYKGKLSCYNQPYKTCIYGAYPLMKQWKMVEHKMEEAENGNQYFSNWRKEQVFDAMKEYAKGFQEGYNNFLTDIIDSKDSLSTSEKIRFQKIKDFVSNRMHNEPGFSESFGSEDKNVFANWFEDGREGGYYYRAWYLILENHIEFAPLFEDGTAQTAPDTKNKRILPLPDCVLPEGFKGIKTKFYEANNDNPSKIQVAALVELFCLNGYFGKAAKPKKDKNPVPVWKNIAAHYFDMFIDAELESSKKIDRERHKELLKKYFKK